MNLTMHTAPRLAVIYIRVSDPRQKIRGDGLRSQQARCEEFAQFQNYNVVEVFEDDMTGGVIKRPGLNSMITFLKKHRKNNTVVIIDDITRFARDVVSHWKLRDMVKDVGGELVSPSMKFGDSSDDILHENMMAAMAQHQRQKNAEQTQNRMRGRLLNGYWVFAAPAGYRYEHVTGHSKVLKHDEPLASIVKEALEGFASGRFGSQAEVRRFLEAHTKFPKTGNDLVVRPMVVSRMLNQTLYAGIVEHSAWGISPRKGHHEALVSLEIYDRIQERLKKKKQPLRRREVRKDFPLRGAVACADCGRSHTAAWSKGNTKRYAYYVCQNKQCDSYGKSIRKEQIEDDFAYLLAEVTPSPKLYAVMNEVFTKTWEQMHEQRRELNKARVKESEEIQKSIDDLLNRIIETDTLSVVKVYEKKIDTLEKQKLLLIEKIETSDQNYVRPKDKLELSMRFLRNPLQFWNSGDYELQRMAVKLTFANHLSYCRDQGYRTPNLSLPFKMLEQIQNDKNKLVRLTGKISNSLFNELASWNEQLKHLEDSPDTS